ncbi:hypothetical protein WM00_30995 [Burkholderia cepacia]|nr:hypothetical protein WM00_30995 [Burkholderia cepacia]
MSATNHEFVVFRTGLPDDALPVGKGQEMEHTLKTIGEAGDIAPGHDALICNKPGRYEAGMHTALVVTP